MFCMFLLPLSETKVTTQGSGSASTCSRPASNDSCDNDQKTNGDRQLPAVQVAACDQLELQIDPFCGEVIYGKIYG